MPNFKIIPLILETSSGSEEGCQGRDGHRAVLKHPLEGRAPVHSKIV